MRIETNVQIIQIWAVDEPAKGKQEREGSKDVRDLNEGEIKGRGEEEECQVTGKLFTETTQSRPKMS